MFLAGVGVFDWFGFFPFFFFGLDWNYRSPLLSLDSLNAFIPNFVCTIRFVFSIIFRLLSFSVRNDNNIVIVLVSNFNLN